MGMPRWNLKDEIESRIRITILLIVVLILVHEFQFGSGMSQFAGMYLCLFALIAAFLTNKVQRQLFTSIMEYAQALRIISFLMSIAFFAIWLFTVYHQYFPATAL